MIALDTNILVYADAAPDPLHRNEIALQLIARLTLVPSLIPVQVLGEFLNVSRRKGFISFEKAKARITAYSALFDTPVTRLEHVEDAAEMAERHNLQYFDALIVCVSQRAGATMLLSEDMHDGLVIDGLTILNPFAPANESALAERLGAAL